MNAAEKVGAAGEKPDETTANVGANTIGSGPKLRGTREEPDITGMHAGRPMALTRNRPPPGSTAERTRKPNYCSAAPHFFSRNPNAALDEACDYLQSQFGLSNEDTVWRDIARVRMAQAEKKGRTDGGAQAVFGNHEKERL